MNILMLGSYFPCDKNLVLYGLSTVTTNLKVCFA